MGVGLLFFAREGRAWNRKSSKAGFGWVRGSARAGWCSVIDLGRIFANAIARRVAFVVVAAALSWCGMGKSHAADHPGATQALAGCQAAKSAQQNHNTAAGVSRPINCQYYATWPNRQDRSGYSCEQTFPNGSKGVCIDTDSVHTFPKMTCPTGTTFDPLTAQCGATCGAGEWKDPTNPSQCLNEQKCRDRNTQNFDVNAPRLGNAASSCVGGCDLSFDQSRTSKVTVAGATMFQGPMSYPGGHATCPTDGTPDVTQPPSTDEKQKCTPAGAGQTLCVKRETGEHCATASTGKQICWKPGETGEKTDADVLQKRNAGDQPIPPNLNLPNGDQLQPKGTPINTVTTINNTTTITTTITNYNTVNGTDANAGTGGDAGQPDDGTGDDDGDEDGASGGQDCEHPPIVAGDAALNMVANQAWATRCAVDAGNAASVTGDVGDCKSPFTVSGNNANAIKLRAMRKQICPMEGETAPAESSYLGDAGTNAGVIVEGVEHGASGLDDGGLGLPRTCPAPPSVNIGGRTITINSSVFCDWISVGGQIFLLLAALASLRIMASAGGG